MLCGLRAWQITMRPELTVSSARLLVVPW